MTTVSLPEEISALFADAQNDFPVIIGKPSDDDVQRLLRRKFASLQDIYLGDGTDATGLILSKENHKAANVDQVFNRADGSLEAYDPSIRDDDKNTVPLLQDKTWYRKFDFQVAI